MLFGCLLCYDMCVIFLCCRVCCRIQPFVDQYKRKMSAADYETKVPVKVQATNADKLAGYEAELAATLTAMESFESMRI